jgi:hypothetical protein
MIPPPAASKPIPCDAGALRAGVGTVEALARLQLAAVRCGRTISLCNASRELKSLIDFMGLADVLPCVRLRIEALREVEEREQRLRVEEERELGDSAGRHLEDL